MKVNPGSL